MNNFISFTFVIMSLHDSIYIAYNMLNFSKNKLNIYCIFYINN